MSKAQSKRAKVHTEAVVPVAAKRTSLWVDSVRCWLPCLVMLLGVLVVYLPPGILAGDSTLRGLDFSTLHERRIRYAQESLTTEFSLPGWYSRELLGTPFWSNLQSFPLIPGRLLLLILPADLVFVAGVSLAALLAALSLYLLLRRWGLGRNASAVGGWTFACSGFFASRVLAGHLPLLEAYPALPLLMWLVDRVVRPESQTVKIPRRVLALAVGCASVAVAGHPQLPIYAGITAVAYAVWQTRLRALRLGAIMLAGVGLMGFALVPFAMLILRSTRLLPLDAPENDLAMPYGRLLALLWPWRDGWPAVLDSVRGSQAFTSYPNDAYFWDTVGYVGWMPWIAVAALGFTWLRSRGEARRSSDLPAGFLCALSLIALLLSLPAVQSATKLLPGVVLRSPSRWLYVVTFGLAIAVAVACDRMLRSPFVHQRRWAVAAVVVGVAVHLADLGVHSRQFVQLAPRSSVAPPAQEEANDPAAGRRVAIDYFSNAPLNRQADDVGFFDSLMLAGPYRLVIQLSGAPASLNTQVFNGSMLTRPALRFLGVSVVVTTMPRPDLQATGDQTVYLVPDPMPRAVFVPARFAKVGDGNSDLLSAALTRIATDRAAPEDALLIETPLAGEVPGVSSPTTAPASPPVVLYQRQISDRIHVTTQVSEAGFIRLMESADPGWTATVDGKAVPVVRAFGAVMAIPVTAGNHQLELVYNTPGTGAGCAVSVAAFVALAIMMRKWNQAGCFASEQRQTVAPTNADKQGIVR